MNEENITKLQMLFIAKMISEFTGYSLKEISNMDQDQINSYVETLKRAAKFEQN